jgi:hypothetical protein
MNLSDLSPSVPLSVDGEGEAPETDSATLRVS